MTNSNSKNPRRSSPSGVLVKGWAGHCTARTTIRQVTDHESLLAAVGSCESWLPRGNGCSYGDAALNDGGTLIHPTFPTAFPVFTETGRVRVSASWSLAELLAQCSIQGWTLPVVPGVLSATVGGMVAADVHGKNHLRAGSFGSAVEAVELLLPNGERVHCSRREEPEIFHASLGGMGLTGIITDVTLQMVPQCEPFAEVQVTPSSDLPETLSKLDQVAQEQDHASAWVDFSLSSRNRGRGIVIGGKKIPVEDAGGSGRLWEPQSGPELPPLPKPGEGLILWHNRIFHLLSRMKTSPSYWPLEKLLFPLEAWSSWNRVYGAKGFHQHQSLIPEAGGAQSVEALFERVREAGISPTLAVIKRMGPGLGGLSFPAPGWTVSLDFAHGPGVISLLERLNQFTAEVGGRVYLAKDSTLTEEQFQKMYPAMDGFMQVRRRVDPDRRIQSDLAARLGL